MPSIRHSLPFGIDLQHLNEKLLLLSFFRNVLAPILQWKIPYSKLLLVIKVTIFVDRFSKFLRQNLGLLEYNGSGIKIFLFATGTIYLSQLRDVTKALPGKLPVQIKFRLFPIDCDVRDVLF